MPMPFKKPAQTDGVQEETDEPQTCYAFRFRTYWFVLAQTEGEDTPIPPIPGFEIDTALCALNPSSGQPLGCPSRIRERIVKVVIFHSVKAGLRNVNTTTVDHCSA
jgi:hypothetical protein